MDLVLWMAKIIWYETQKLFYRYKTMHAVSILFMIINNNCDEKLKVKPYHRMIKDKCCPQGINTCIQYSQNSQNSQNSQKSPFNLCETVVDFPSILCGSSSLNINTYSFAIAFMDSGGYLKSQKSLKSHCILMCANPLCCFKSNYNLLLILVMKFAYHFSAFTFNFSCLTNAIYYEKLQIELQQIFVIWFSAQWVLWRAPGERTQINTVAEKPACK